jgi:Cu(I)/Ag(I) efflux system membrane fusion protein
MKKYITYIGMLAIGLLLGWFLFGSSSYVEKESNHDTVAETIEMWTCSMHPQIMQPEAGDCPICGMDLIPAETSAEGLTANEIKMTENAVALANIETIIVGRKDISDEYGLISLSGKITVNDENNSVQASYFDGRLERLNVAYNGQKVNRGQLLATIYAPNLVAAQQELITAASLKETQPSLYKAVRNKLKLWKLSESQINSIELTGKVKTNFPIYATVSGTVTMVMAAEGDYLKQGQPILKVSNLSSVWAEFDAYENQIPQFKKGQKVIVVTNAYPNKEFDAVISFINPVLNNSTRTVTIRATLANKVNLFKPGMFITGKIKGLEQVNQESLNIPASAVLWTGTRSLVYIKTNPNEPIFEMREITLGVRNGDNYEILDGLENGEEIVTNGTFTVDAVAQLQGKKSMMNKKGVKTTTSHEGHLDMENNTLGNDEKESNNNERLKVSKSFQNKLNNVFNDYINLKDALVKDDSNTAIKESKKLLENLSKIEMKQINAKESHKRWMSLAKEIKSAAISITNSTKIKEQRMTFKNLSIHLTTSIEVFGINRKVYHQFCPMADNNKGAYWLSIEEKVINPYFGDAMLTCGEIKQVIE